jgi:hypothetical protein
MFERVNNGPRLPQEIPAHDERRTRGEKMLVKVQLSLGATILKEGYVLIPYPKEPRGE